jgi:hypothetical protein
MQLLGFKSYAQDEATRDANGYRLPWLVTDVIKDIFNRCGVPADELDIPDLPMRLWLGGPKDTAETAGYILKPGTDPTKSLEFFVRDYLGAALQRDPNAGPRGMWRLIFPPANYNNLLLTVHILHPSFLDTKDPVDDSAYPSGHTFCQFRNFREWTVRPEASSVTVIGMDPVTKLQIPCTMVNYNLISNQFLLGRYQPLVRHPDPAIRDFNTAAIIANNLFARTCVQYAWVAVRTPLTLVTDPLDPLQVRPRPLRLNDVIQVGTRKAVVRFCRISYGRSDEQQFQSIQAVYVT